MGFLETPGRRAAKRVPSRWPVQHRRLVKRVDEHNGLQPASQLQCQMGNYMDLMAFMRTSGLHDDGLPVDQDLAHAGDAPRQGVDALVCAGPHPVSEHTKLSDGAPNRL